MNCGSLETDEGDGLALPDADTEPEGEGFAVADVSDALGETDGEPAACGLHAARV